DAAFHQLAGDRFAHRLGEVRVVARLGVMGAQVEHFVAAGREVVADLLLEIEAGVVSGEGDAHGGPPRTHIVRQARRSRWAVTGRPRWIGTLDLGGARRGCPVISRIGDHPSRPRYPSHGRNIKRAYPGSISQSSIRR